MFSLQFKTSIALLLTGFVIGFCMSFLFKGCDTTDTRTVNVIPVADYRKLADNTEKKALERVSVLEKENTRLQSSLASSNNNLLQAKQRAKQTAQRIKKLTEPKGVPTKELLQKLRPFIPNDTIKATPCDSLANAANEYIQENDYKDSLYETKIQLLDSVVLVKDSVIAYNQQSYNGLHQILDHALEQQKALELDNKDLKKHFRRQRLKNKMVTIGLMILSGAAADYLIHH